MSIKSEIDPHNPTLTPWARREQAILEFAATHFWRFEVIGKEKVSSSLPAVIAIANHFSDPDSIFIRTAFKDIILAAGKEHFIRNPARYRLMSATAPTFLLSRENPRQGIQEIDASAQYLEKGLSVAFYIDGTRLTPSTARPIEERSFFSGIAHLSQIAKRPIIPALLLGNQNIMPRDQLPNLATFRQPVTLVVGDPIDPLDKDLPSHSKQAKHAIMSQVQDQLAYMDLIYRPLS